LKKKFTYENMKLQILLHQIFIRILSDPNVDSDPDPAKGSDPDPPLPVLIGHRLYQ